MTLLPCINSDNVAPARHGVSKIVHRARQWDTFATVSQKIVPSEAVMDFREFTTTLTLHNGFCSKMGFSMKSLS